MFGTSPVSLYDAPLSHLKDSSLGFTAENLAAILEEKPTCTVPASMLGSQNYWQKAVDYADTAIVVISHSGSGSADLTATDLQLRDAEKELIKEIRANFDSVIILFNIFNVMEMGWLDDLSMIGGSGEIDAVMIIWDPGELGMTAVADVNCT